MCKKGPREKSKGSSGNKNELLSSDFLREWVYTKKSVVRDFLFDSLIEKFFSINQTKDAHNWYLVIGPFYSDDFFVILR